MSVRAALVFAALSVAAAPAGAFTAQDAADCAAFSMGNWDFEAERFSEEDQSPE